MSMPYFVRADGRRFVVGDQEFKFVGFNTRGLTHYGYQDGILPDATAAQRTEFLAEAQAVKSSVIRLFLPHVKVRSDEALIDRLGTVLANAKSYQQRVIVCLIDHLETSKFQHWSLFNEDESPKPGTIYTDKHGHNVLSPQFYADGYQGDFLNYVEKVVSAFRNDPAVFCWELTNEGSNHPNHDHFIAYCNTLAAKIRAIDPSHMITAGIISTPVIEFKNEGGNDKPARLYENLDFITVHDYDAISSEDRYLSQRLNKPLIVEEVGRVNERDGFFRNNMDFWFNNGASGYLGWGYMPSAQNNGDGDHDFGIDRAIHGDYDVVTQVWKDRAAGLPDVAPL